MKPRYKQYPVVAVSSIIVSKGMILLIKRKYPPGQGKWGLPGGHVEYGETLTDAVIREIKEETNYKIKPTRYLFPCTVIRKRNHKDTSPVIYHYIIHVFEGKIVGGKLKAATDAEEAKWVTIDQALNMNLTKSTRESLKKYIKGEICNEIIVFFYDSELNNRL